MYRITIRAFDPPGTPLSSEENEYPKAKRAFEVLVDEASDGRGPTKGARRWSASVTYVREDGTAVAVDSVEEIRRSA